MMYRVVTDWAVENPLQVADSVELQAGGKLDLFADSVALDQGLRDTASGEFRIGVR